MNTTNPFLPDFVNSQFLSRKGYAEYLTDMRDNNFTNFPSSAVRESTKFRQSTATFVVNDDKVTVSEFKPTKVKLTRDTFVHFGPTSTFTKDKVTKIKGTSKDDFMFGRVNGDKLVGGKGDDFLVGSHGKDVLIGGKGTDYFWGGTGSDKYKDIRGNDFFLSLDLYNTPDVIVDKLKNVQIANVQSSFATTVLTHSKGTITIANWGPKDIIESGMFNLQN